LAAIEIDATIPGKIPEIGTRPLQVESAIRATREAARIEDHVFPCQLRGRSGFGDPCRTCDFAAPLSRSKLRNIEGSIRIGRFRAQSDVLPFFNRQRIGRDFGVEGYGRRPTNNTLSGPAAAVLRVTDRPRRWPELHGFVVDNERDFPENDVRFRAYGRWRVHADRAATIRRFQRERGDVHGRLWRGIDQGNVSDRQAIDPDGPGLCAGRSGCCGDGLGGRVRRGLRRLNVHDDAVCFDVGDADIFAAKRIPG
jgi:hypothetical protein